MMRKRKKELQTVFYDDNAIMFDDPEHSMEEEKSEEKSVF